MGTEKLATTIVYLLSFLFAGEVIWNDYAQAHALPHETPVWVISIISGAMSGACWYLFRRNQK